MATKIDLFNCIDNKQQSITLRLDITFTATKVKHLYKYLFFFLKKFVIHKIFISVYVHKLVLSLSMQIDSCKRLQSLRWLIQEKNN